MRILIISRGPLGYLTDAAKLCEYAVQRHQVTFLSFESLGYMLRGEQWTSIPEVATRVVRLGGCLPVRFARWLSACFQETRKGYDLIYVYYFPGCSLLRSVRCRKAFVLDIRTGSTLRRPVLRCAQDVITAFEARSFPHVTVISEGLRRNLKVPPAAAHILPLGADPFECSPKRFDFLHLLYVGNLDPRRRICDTIDGFHRFYTEMSPAMPLRYTIVGEGPSGERERLQNQVRRLGLHDLIDLPGYVSHGQLGPYLEGCNVGVSYVPITTYYDHQPPTKTFEYLLSGMPVIATATAENRRVVSDFNGVLITDTSDAFCRGLHQLTERRAGFDSAVIRSSISRYTWRDIIERNALPFLESVAAKYCERPHHNQRNTKCESSSMPYRASRP